VQNSLRTTRVVNVVGPRQTGKTTMVRDMVADSDEVGRGFRLMSAT
jgi:molybdopterin-guanine dinucleotide biosynthesis protein